MTRLDVTRLDSTVVLRALAIVLIVGSHTHLFSLAGGAHALLAVAGYNFARFRLPAVPRTDRVRGMARAASRVLLPSAVVIGLAALATPGLGLVQAAMLNSVLGPDTLGPTWRYWFVEALLQVLLLVGVLLAIPRLDRAERARPLAFAGALLAVGLLLRFTLPLLATGPEVTQSGAAVLWLFAAGWCAALARTSTHRLLVTGAVLAALPGFLGDAGHELVVAALLGLVIWTRTLPVPRWVRPLLGALAGSSLYTYLVHWQVLPLGAVLPPAAVVGSCLLVGFACWRLARTVSAWVRPWLTLRHEPT